MVDAATLARIAALAENIEDKVSENRRFIGLIYGDSGAGKTTLAADIVEEILPSKKGCLVIDTSDNYTRAGLDMRKKFMRQRFTTFEDLSDIITAIEHGIGKYKHIGAVILDESTSMAEADTDNSFDTRRSLIEAGQKKMPESGIPEVPEWPDYRRSLVRYRALLSDLYAVDGLHVIHIAHEVSDNKTNKIRAAFSPSILDRIVKPMHLVARLVTKQVSRGTDEVSYVSEVQVHPTNLVAGKCCLPVSSVKFDSSALPEIAGDWVKEGAVPVPELPEQKETQPVVGSVENMIEAESPEHAASADEFGDFESIQ